ncbi:Surfactant protein B, partial [Trichostrongylus colubriformis]
SKLPTPPLQENSTTRHTLPRTIRKVFSCLIQRINPVQKCLKFPFQTDAHVETPIHPLYAFFRAARTIETPTGSVLMSCLECKLAVEEAIHSLIEDRNNQAAAVQKFACHELLPSNFSASCDDFLSLYLPTVLYMTWEQFTPEGVCTNKIKSCDTVSISRIALLSKSDINNMRCQSCSGMQDYFKTVMDRPEVIEFQQFVTDELKRSACDRTGILATTVCCRRNIVPS